jgi:tetratricopeptide (TPR) repeat protein
MRDDQTFAELRRRYAEIDAALGRIDPTGGRDAAEQQERLRDEIVGLFRDAEGAIAQLDELRESIRPLVDRYRELFRNAAEAKGAPKERSVRVDHLGSSTFLERGWNAIAGASYDTAVSELEKALSLAPGHTRAEALLGWALMRMDRVSEARQLLEPLLERDPDNHLARANLGYVFMRESRFADAIEHLSRVARESSDRTAALYARLYLGMVYTEREMYRDAETVLTSAIDIGPNLIEAYWELGRAHYRAGDLEAAAAVWRRGAETNRFNPWGERCGKAADRVASGKEVSFG